jgi:hypothetical protein
MRWSGKQAADEKSGQKQSGKTPDQGAGHVASPKAGRRYPEPVSTW